MRAFPLILAVLMLIASVKSCTSQNTPLFDVLSVQIPSSLVKADDNEHHYKNSENGVELRFRMTENKQLAPAMPKINSDSIFNQEMPEGINLRKKEIKEVNGLEVKIVEFEKDQEVTMFFLIEINNELLMSTLTGKVQSVEYMDDVFSKIINSMKK